MSQKETVLEEDICAEAEAAGWFVRKVQWTGRRGAPDRVFIRNGRVVWIEFKRLGRKAQGLQDRELRRMKEVGAQIFRDVDTHKKAREILGL